MKISFDDEVIGDVKKLNLAPGDTVLVEVAGRVSAQDAANIRAHVRRVFPDHEVLVVPADLTVSIISEPDAI